MVIDFLGNEEEQNEKDTFYFSYSVCNRMYNQS